MYDRTGTGSINDQTSWMGRGSLLVGGLIRSDDSFIGHLANGGCVQFEWNDYVSAATGAAVLADIRDLSFVGSGWLDAH